MEALNELALFAGAGGGILGGKLLGWRTICGVEIEPYPTSVLIARENEGFLHPFPIWDDVCTFDGKPWQGVADVVSVGFPVKTLASGAKAQVSKAVAVDYGKKEHVSSAKYDQDSRSWKTALMLTRRGLGTVLGDLAEMGYDAEWCVLGGSNLGAWHPRKRIWILGADHRQERVQRVLTEKVSWKPRVPWCQNVRGIEDFRNRPDVYTPQLRRAGDGMADYMDRIAAIGNGQIPIVAASAWHILLKRLEEK